jgi:hypothetical protein
MSLGKRLAANRQAKRKSFDVSEWGEDEVPLTVYSGMLTCGDIDKLQRKHPNFMSNPTVAAMVDLIIMKAEDKDGEKLFTLEDKPILMRESVTVVSKVAGHMFSTVESQEDLGND